MADWPKYDSTWERMENPTNWEYWTYFRFLLNWVLVAIPGLFWATVMVALNMYTMIDWNRIWAGGNIFLLSKTLYLIGQTIMFIPLIFEVDVWLRHAKFLRFWSLAIASTWNFLYILIGTVYIIQINYPPEWKVYDTFNAFMTCMIAYNLIFDIFSLPINSMIIMKELSMEFF